MSVWILGVDQELVDKLKYVLEKWEDVSKRTSGKVVRYISYPNTDLPWHIEKPLVTVLCFDPCDETSLTAALKVFLPTIKQNSDNPIFLTAVGPATEDILIHRTQLLTENKVSMFFHCIPDHLPDVADLHISILGSCLTITGHDYCTYSEAKGMSLKDKRGTSKKKVQNKRHPPKEGGISSSSCLQFGALPLSQTSTKPNDQPGSPVLPLLVACQFKSSESLGLPAAKGIRNDSLVAEQNTVKPRKTRMRNNFVIRARSYTERQDAFKMQKVLKTVTAIGADSSAEPVQSAYFTLRSPVQSETYSNTFSTHSASSIGSEQSTFQVQNSITQRPDSGLPPTRFAETKYAASSADCPITHHSPHSIVEGEESLTALAMNSAGIDISGDCLLSDVTPRLVTRRASLTQQFGTGETTLEAQRLLQEKKRGHRRSRSENSIYSPCQHDGCGVNCAVTAGREYSKSNPAEAAKQSRLARNVSLMKGTKSIRRAVRRLRSFPSQGKLARKASMKTSSKLGKKDKVYSSEQIDEGEDARRNIDISYETDTSECDDSELDAVGTLSRRLSSELDLEDLLLCLPDDAEEIRRMDLFENQGGE